jgi:hypothetical protein
VWKKREKGHPNDLNAALGGAIDTNRLIKKPNFVVNKDLYFPSSMLYFSIHSRVCVMIGVTTSFKDIKKLNNDIVMYDYDADNIEEVFDFIHKKRTSGEVNIFNSSKLLTTKPSKLLIEHLKESL